MNAPLRPALFLDRDGVLNADKAFVARPQDFDWIPGAKACVRQFNEMGYFVFVVTNQSGIAQGLYSEADMQSVHDFMQRELAVACARIDQIYFCPFHPEAKLEAYRKDSGDRKPNPGMLLRAISDFPVDAARSLMIGDKQTDMAAAAAAGVRGFLYQGGDLLDFALAAAETL